MDWGQGAAIGDGEVNRQRTLQSAAAVKTDGAELKKNVGSEHACI